MAMHLMNIPRNFDVVLTENLFGDILSDEAGVITGSLGMLPSATIGGKVNLYEPVHGSAPDIAGTGKANPLGAILTAAMVLRHSANLEQDAAAIEAAVQQVLDAGHRTADIARGNTGQPPSPPSRWASSSTRRSPNPSTAANPCTPSNQLLRSLGASSSHRCASSRGMDRACRCSSIAITMSTHSSNLAAARSSLSHRSRRPRRAQISNRRQPHRALHPRNPAQIQPQKRPHDNVQWLWQYHPPRARSAASNDLRLDARFQSFLRDSLHRAAILLGPAQPATSPSPTPPSTSSRSPRQVLADDNRYLTIDGCVPHFCPARGLLWVDLGGPHPLVVFAAIDWDPQDHTTDQPAAEYTLWLFSNQPLIDPDAHPSSRSPQAIARWTAQPAAGTASSRTSPTPSSSIPTARRTRSPSTPNQLGANTIAPSTRHHNATPDRPNDNNDHDHNPTTPRTLFEKVWQQHLVAEPAGEPTILYIDLHLVHEVTSPQAFEGLRLAGRKLRRPDRHVATVDHNVPTTSVARPPRHRRPDRRRADQSPAQELRRLRRRALRRAGSPTRASST